MSEPTSCAAAGKVADPTGAGDNIDPSAKVEKIVCNGGSEKVQKVVKIETKQHPKLPWIEGTKQVLRVN